MKSALAAAVVALAVVLVLVGRFHTLYGTPNLFGEPESLEANGLRYVADHPETIDRAQLLARYPGMRQIDAMRPLPVVSLGARPVLAEHAASECNRVLALQLDGDPQRYRIYDKKGAC